MLILETPAAMRAWSDEQRRQGASVVFVPTMGALHDGHLALIDAASARGGVVVVSVFVNKLQFNRPDDFEGYPRHLDRDAELCAQRGVAAIYAPGHESMYPTGFQTHVEPGSVSEPLEGEGRPGHFRGVATVVAKLFNAVRPDVAVFGRKDFQQLAVINRMVIDLDMGIEIVGVDTIREADGLAMSSRNQRLSAEQRQAAVVVPRALDAVEAAVRQGSCFVGDALIENLHRLRELAVTTIAAEPLARLEYFEIVEPTTLHPPTTPDSALLAVAAVWFGDVRLIDNRILR